MIGISLRGEIYHLDGQSHELRGTLGTRIRAVALQHVHRIETALGQGPHSPLWTELKSAIPRGTFERLIKYAGVEPELTATWEELCNLFEAERKHKFKIGEIAEHTLKNYQKTFTWFRAFLAAKRPNTMLRDGKYISEEYCAWRIDQRKNPQSVSGRPSLYFDRCHLRPLGAFGVERGLLENNPFRKPKRPPYERHISRPYSADQLVRMENIAKQGQLCAQLFPSRDEWLPFWLLDETGLRPEDAISLPWQDVDLQAKMIEHNCHKNHKHVSIPLLEGGELLRALRIEYKLRRPLPSEPVLLNMNTEKAFTHSALYELIVKLGKLAGVLDAGPYRSRGTFAVDMLLRNNNPYYVAQLLGDTMRTVERYYMPYVRELQERNRLLAETGVGLRQYVTPESQSEPKKR
jgi:integrase